MGYSDIVFTGCTYISPRNDKDCKSAGCWTKMYWQYPFGQSQRSNCELCAPFRMKYSSKTSHFLASSSFYFAILFILHLFTLKHSLLHLFLFRCNVFMYWQITKRIPRVVCKSCYFFSNKLDIQFMFKLKTKETIEISVAYTKLLLVSIIRTRAVNERKIFVLFFFLEVRFVASFGYTRTALSWGQCQTRSDASGRYTQNALLKKSKS